MGNTADQHRVSCTYLSSAPWPSTSLRLAMEDVFNTGQLILLKLDRHNWNNRAIKTKEKILTKKSYPTETVGLNFAFLLPSGEW